MDSQKVYKEALFVIKESTSQLEAVSVENQHLQQELSLKDTIIAGFQIHKEKAESTSLENVRLKLELAEKMPL